MGLCEEGDDQWGPWSHRFRLLSPIVRISLKTFGAAEAHMRRSHRVLQEVLLGETDFAAVPVEGPVRGEDALARLR